VGVGAGPGLLWVVACAACVWRGKLVCLHECHDTPYPTPPPHTHTHAHTQVRLALAGKGPLDTECYMHPGRTGCKVERLLQG
jgi:hypothetical protein